MIAGVIRARHAVRLGEVTMAFRVEEATIEEIHAALEPDWDGVPVDMPREESEWRT